MMAFDAEYKENQNKTKDQASYSDNKSILKEVLKVCSGLLGYVCLNGQNIHIEFILGLLYIGISLIWRKWFFVFH